MDEGKNTFLIYNKSKNCDSMRNDNEQLKDNLQLRGKNVAPENLKTSGEWKHQFNY